MTEPVLSLFTRRLSGTGDPAQIALLTRMNDDGRIYLTQTRVDGEIAIRAAVGQFETTEADVRTAWDVIAGFAGNEAIRPHGPPGAEALRP